jgi:mannose-1-phosphate guanylyltransferase
MTRGAIREGATDIRRPAHAIVLAGGSGERLRPVTERWLGEYRPKQYCTFVGTRSMLQHTLDRVKTVVPQRNIVTVIAAEHERYLASAVPAPFPGTLVRQPSNRGTAVGVFLPLAYVLERDPNATVMVFPCDHFIYPEGRFLQYVMASYGLCRGLQDSLLLLAVPATSVETDYGWIEAAGPIPGSPIAPLRPIERMIEKPSTEGAAALLRRGGWWNTMVLAARASTLWELGRRLLPDVIEAFESVRQGLRAAPERPGSNAEREASVLRDAYDHLRPADFSADFLARAVDSTLVFPLEDLLWSDWGRPKRVMHSIQELGLQAPARLASAF